MQEEIKNILSRNLARKGLLKAAYSANVCALAKDVGKGDFEPISFRDGVLKLSVDSAAKAHLIKMQELSFIDQINEKIGSKIVNKITYKID